MRLVLLCALGGCILTIILYCIVHEIYSRNVLVFEYLLNVLEIYEKKKHTEKDMRENTESHSDH